MLEMMGKLQAAWNRKMIQAKICLEDCKDKAAEAVKSEKGAVDIVVILLLIVVVIALVAIFKDELTELVESVFGKLDESVANDGGSAPSSGGGQS